MEVSRGRLVVLPLLCALAVVALPAEAASQTPVPMAWPWLARISIVWPHDAEGRQAAVGDATLVDVSVWPSSQVACEGYPECRGYPGFPALHASGRPVECIGYPELGLWVARDNEPIQPAGGRAELGLRSLDGSTFPTVEFGDVPVSLAADPSTRYSFVVPLSSSVWVHATDPRTVLPEPVIPAGYGAADVRQVDTRIQIVWPHDEAGNFAPVGDATRVNVAVDIFEHGTLRSVPLGWPQWPAAIELYGARENDGMSFTRGPGDRHTIPPLWANVQSTTYTSNGQEYPRWVFNDVPVEPGVQYHFLVIVDSDVDVESFPTIWTHAADARTYMPDPEPPPSCVP